MKSRMNRSAPATGATLMTIPLDVLHEHPDNPRRHFDPDKLKELAASIAEKGVLNPLLARPQGKGWQILAGARRYRAALQAGLAEVPVLVRELDDAAALELMVTDNQQRQDVHPLEEAQGYHLLMTKGKLEVAQIAAKIGLSVKYVYDRVKLLSLTKAAQDEFLAGHFTAGHAILLARLSPQDQERVMDLDTGGLWSEQKLLYHPERDDESDVLWKPVSVRELEAWIDKNVRFQAVAPDPMLFPETAEVLNRAHEEAEKVVHITHDDHVVPEAKEEGKRTYGPASWKRADGTEKNKSCPHAVTGVIVVGPGRGEAFKVCVDKKRCAAHWGSERRAAERGQAAATKGGATGEDRYAIQRRKEQEQAERDKAERDRWQKASKPILEALAAAVKKAPAGAKGELAEIVIKACESWTERVRTAERFLGRGSSAEDAVRFGAFLILARKAGDWYAPKDFPKVAKALGIDVKKIVDQAAPVEKPAAAAPAKGSAAKKASAANGKPAKRKKPAARASA